MRLRSSLAVGALTAAIVTGLAPATAMADVESAGDPAPTAALAGNVIVAHGGVAYVPMTYTCTNDADHPFNHLFVAVKQGPRVNTTDRSGSSFATTFYSTNWSVDQGPNALTCDGTSHTQTLVLKNDPGWAKTDTAPPLRSGPALLQICLFDNGSPDSDGGFVFNYTMQRVLAAGGRS